MAHDEQTRATVRRLAEQSHHYLDRAAGVLEADDVPASELRAIALGLFALVSIEQGVLAELNPDAFRHPYRVGALLERSNGR